MPKLARKKPVTTNPTSGPPQIMYLALNQESINALTAKYANLNPKPVNIKQGDTKTAGIEIKVKQEDVRTFIKRTSRERTVIFPNGLTYKMGKATRAFNDNGRLTLIPINSPKFTTTKAEPLPAPTITSFE